MLWFLTHAFQKPYNSFTGRNTLFYECVGITKQNVISCFQSSHLTIGFYGTGAGKIDKEYRIHACLDTLE